MELNRVYFFAEPLTLTNVTGPCLYCYKDSLKLKRREVVLICVLTDTPGAKFGGLRSRQLVDPYSPLNLLYIWSFEPDLGFTLG